MKKKYYWLPLNKDLIPEHGFKTLGMTVHMHEEDRGHLWLLLKGKWCAGELLCDRIEDLKPITSKNLFNFYKAIL